MGRSRQAHPDYAIDPDRGSSASAVKIAALVDRDQHAQRADDRAGLRELDQMTEELPGLNRLQRDRARILPRETNADLRHPRMQRRLPHKGETRRPLSARQRRERSKTRRRTQRSMPLAQLREQKNLVTRPEQWRELNDKLSESLGDIDALKLPDQQRIRRIDRAIQSYERGNDRGHVVYTAVQMPAYINGHNLPGFLANNFQPGDRVAFDRYTQGTHQLHETVGYLNDPERRVAVFEIETRRGAYLGQSDRLDNTQHLLPRGLELEVVSVHPAAYMTPAGLTDTRMVVQLRDATTALDTGIATKGGSR